MTTVPSIDEDIAPLDGHTARAVRTRAAIVEACIELIDEGDLRPTAPRIAERASVSVRSVFQHFADLDTLFVAVGGRVVERSQHLVGPIDPELPLAERVDALVTQRTRLLEELTPIRRSAMVHQADSPEIGRMFGEAHELGRTQVKGVFQHELASLEDGRRQLIDAIDVALSWSTWEVLRMANGRSIDEARAVVQQMVGWALAGAGVRSS
jgi:TetR/AcrR family transcriptional regulator, regulator of autoinduction and epiphytic fitness